MPSSPSDYSVTTAAEPSSTAAKSRSGTKTPLSSMGIEKPTPIFGRYRCKHPAIPNLHCHSTQRIRPTALVITRHQRKITYIRYHTFKPNTPTAHITRRPKPNLWNSSMPPAAAQFHQPGSKRLRTVTLLLGHASPLTSLANISPKAILLNNKRIFHGPNLNQRPLLTINQSLSLPTNAPIRSLLPSTTSQARSQTRKFTTTSSQGHKYVLILYDYDSNSILAKTMRNHSDGTLTRVQQPATVSR
jgi:hypothetical protein